MSDKPIIAGGVLVFVGLVTLPLWHGVLATEEIARPELELPEDQSNCIEDTEYMRARHEDLLNEWRNIVGEIPGVDKLTFSTVQGGPAGNPIEIKLVGKDFQPLRQAADMLKAEIATYPGTFDITDNFKPGKPESQIRIKEGAKSLGISMSDIAKQIRQAFYGEEALRIQRGRDDLKVLVRYAENDRKNIFGMEEMRIRTSDGQEIPIDEVASIQRTRAYSTIQRVDRKQKYQRNCGKNCGK